MTEIKSNRKIDAFFRAFVLVAAYDCAPRNLTNS